MEKEDKIFLAIILGAVIIGVFLYSARLPLGQSLKNSETVSTPKFQNENSQNLSSKNAQTKVKNDLISVPEKSVVGTCGASENTIVTKVIDGDTVVVEGGYHVRLLGMDADEKGYPCYDAAKTRLEDLALSKNVVLEKDKTDLDQYGRCLRYIFVGNINTSIQLVQEGLAVARFYEPDVKYKTEITQAEQQAQQNKTGCKWSGAPQTKNN